MIAPESIATGEQNHAASCQGIPCARESGILKSGISRSIALEQLEDGANRALHFLIGIEHDLVAIIHVTNRQRELELTFARLVELAAMEARANDVQLGL